MKADKKMRPHNRSSVRGAKHATKRSQAISKYNTTEVIRPFKDWNMPDEAEYEAKRKERRDCAIAVIVTLLGLCAMWQGTWIYGVFRWGWGC